jgi:hypothetical protein
MKLALDELIKGKSTLIKGKSFLSTEQYVSPFIEKMSVFTNDFIFNAILPPQLTNEGSTTDITYNRVWAQAILPEEYSIEGHDEVIGFIYALDTRKPLYKIYRGYLNRACLNLCVFDPTWIEVQELQPETKMSFNVEGLLEMESTFASNIKVLKETFISPEEMLGTLGKWVDGCLRKEYTNKVHTVKLSPEIAISAYKSLYIDEESTYYTKPTEQSSMFNAYNAFTQIITDDKKEIINPAERTLLINSIL